MQATNRQNAIQPKVFMANGKEHVFDKRDPIFYLSRPVQQGEETNECSYCGEPFKKATQRKWCEFCGQNMCQKCCRTRVFPMPDTDKSYNHGEIDLLCLKKFHIREMTEQARITCIEFE